MQEQRRVADVGGDPLPQIIRDIGQHDPAALARDDAGFHLSHAARRSRDDRDLAGEPIYPRLSQCSLRQQLCPAAAGEKEGRMPEPPRVSQWASLEAV